MKIIYRALPSSAETIFRTNDYVTLSEKFALEHAETSAIYNGEDYAVIKAVVQDNDIKPASNPGEYLMTKDAQGKVAWNLILDDQTQTVKRKRSLSSYIKEIFDQEPNLKENQNYTHLLVDIQPEYQKYIGFDISELMEEINQELEKNVNVVVLYNGHETLDMNHKNNSFMKKTNKKLNQIFSEINQ